MIPPLLKTWTPPPGLNYPVELNLPDGKRNVREAAAWTHTYDNGRVSKFWLNYDSAGRFYATEQIREGEAKKEKVIAKSTAIIRPAQALQMLFTRLLREDPFTHAVCAHLESSQFGFVDEIEFDHAPAPKRKSRAKKGA